MFLVKQFNNNWLFFTDLFIQGKIMSNLLENLDRNKTDSHRFKPTSRNILIDEQSNHFYQLQQKDMSRRHRGRKR